MYNCLTSWGLFYNGTVPTAFRAGESFAFKQLLLLTLARAQKTGCVECSVCPRTKLSAARCAADKGQKAKFQTTSSLDARTASRRAVLSWVFILCRAAKNEPRKRARTFPPGPPCDAALHSGQRKKTSLIQYISRHLATTRGRRRKQERFCLKFC